MPQLVKCLKLGKKAPRLTRQPYPGEIGKRIYENISEQAWQLWLQHQTMLINEYRLNMLDAEARQFLEKEMERFLFGEGSEKPPGFITLKGEK